MSMVEEQSAFLLDACKLIQFATERGFTVTGGELARTPEQQAIYVKTGRSTTMNSIHIKRCAIDLNFFLDGKLCYDVDKLKEVGEFWQSLNPKNQWGGFWKVFRDIPHFQRTV